jgi:hypothetical protein
MHGLSGHGCCPQQQFGVGTKGTAGVGNDQADAGAGKKLYRKRIFQGLDASAHGGLADAKGFGRTVKAAKRRYRQKSLNLVDFHDLLAGEFLHLRTSYYHSFSG